VKRHVLARWATIRTGVVNFANARRKRFDSLTEPPVLLVTGLLIIAAGTGWLVGFVAAIGCGKLPFSLFDLELTFSADTFTAMLETAAKCRNNVALSFVTADLIFPVAYALLLAAVYLWAERLRRFLPDEWEPGASETGLVRSRERPITPAPLRLLSSIVVVLPYVAAFLDIVVENIPLAIAAWLAPSGPNARPDGLVRALVWLGSFGAALKWTTLAVFALGLIGRTLRGPRGLVLWRVRFSVLAVLVGAIPLLLIPQGQDILQRLAEGDHPYVRIWTAIIVLTGAAMAVWYSARVLTLARLSRDEPRREDEWLLFFERNIPRMLGVAVLVLVGAALANAGLALKQFGLVTAVAYLATYALGRNYPDVLRAIGRRFVPPRSREAGPYMERVGHALLASALAVFIVWPSSARPFIWRYDASQRDQFALRLAAWLAVMAAWSLYLFVYHRRTLAAASQGGAPDLHEELRRGYAIDTLPPSAVRVAVIAAAASGTLLVLFTFGAVWVGRLFGPLVVLSLTVTNAVFIGSVVAYWGRKLRLPLVSLLLALSVVLSRWNDNHEIRTLPLAASADTVAAPGELRTRFRTWLAARAVEDTGTVPVVLVAAAGGGLRAGYWTSLVLATLQDRNTAFARHVFAISGVSGGSVGATVFAAMARDIPKRKESTACVSATDCVRRFMRDDYLSPVLAKMVAPDFAQWFVPVPIHWFDRATALEQSWERSYETTVGDSTLSSAYLSFYRDPSAVREVPLLLLNTTHVETGRRYVTAPFNDEGVFLDSRTIHHALGADMRLSTAAHNSARFTYVSPAGRLERRDGVSYGAVVDGGYFESSALATLGDVRREIMAALADTSALGDSVTRAAARRTRLVVVYLCNSPIGCRRDVSIDSSLAAQRGLAAEWLAPVKAVLNAQGARGGLARAQVARAPGSDFLQINVCDTLATQSSQTSQTKLEVGRSRVVNPPLGWLLSRLARNWMDSSLTSGRAAADTATRRGVKSCRQTNVAALDSIGGFLARR
jgi:hypothetical protein